MSRDQREAACQDLASKAAGTRVRGLDDGNARRSGLAMVGDGVVGS